MFIIPYWKTTDIFDPVTFKQKHLSLKKVSFSVIYINIILNKKRHFMNVSFFPKIY